LHCHAKEYLIIPPRRPMNIAIIPARSGSKGIPDKNIRPFCGVPLLARAIRSARAASSVHRVVVSTDSERYAELARKEGADVVLRPPELSGDEASSESALLHALEEVGGDPRWVVFVQCTSPFTRADDIDRLVAATEAAGADTGFTAVASHSFLWRNDQSGNAVGVNHDKAVRPRRQEREPEFGENGAVYVMDAKGFLRQRHRFFGKTVVSEMPAWTRLEIDSPHDWSVAEAIFAGRARQVEGALPAKVSLVVFDFDGVMTDNRVLVDQDGRESVFCDRGDGMGVGRLLAAGIPALILSKERNPVVEARARKLNIPFAQAIDRKAEFLREWCREHGIDLGEVVYVGNDLNDLECFEVVGCAVAVADSVPELIARADLVLSRPGGRGAVREICDAVLKRPQTTGQNS